MRSLATQLAYEDEQEDLGRLDANDRTTCFTCQTWAGPEHRETADHKRRIGIPEDWRYDEREGRYRPDPPVVLLIDECQDLWSGTPSGGKAGSAELVERLLEQSRSSVVLRDMKASDIVRVLGEG